MKTELNMRKNLNAASGRTLPIQGFARIRGRTSLNPFKSSNRQRLPCDEMLMPEDMAMAAGLTD